LARQLAFAELPGFAAGQGLFTAMLRLVLGFTQPPMQWAVANWFF